MLDADRVGTLLDGARRFADSAALVAPEGEQRDASSPPSSLMRAERAADAMLDLLSEDSPAAQLVTEQLVLMLGASSRQLWHDLRTRSGSFQQRSVLGRIVDPLGLFRHSALITNDERDRAALQAAAKLSALAAELLGEAPSVIGGTAPVGAASASEAADQQSQLVRALLRKAYERRVDLRRASRRLAIEALDQAAGRLAGQGARELRQGV